MTVHWANKEDAAGFHIAYGPAQDNLIWGVEVADGKASQYTLQNLPGGDLWVAVIAKSSSDCGGPSSPVVQAAVGPQVLGVTGFAQNSLLSAAAVGFLTLGLWQLNVLLRRDRSKAR